jgi:hypothetical protein
MPPLVESYLDAGFCQFPPCKFQGLRIGIQPEHFSASMSMLYEEGESAGSAAQVENSVPILNSCWPKQSFLET